MTPDLKRFEFARKLRTLREKTGLNRTRVALDTGVDPRVIWQLEHGIGNPVIGYLKSKKILEGLARTFNMPFEYFLEDVTIED